MSTEPLRRRKTLSAGSPSLKRTCPSAKCVRVIVVLSIVADPMRVVVCRGTSPSQAARLRPRAKVCTLPTAARRAVALRAPMPGMLVSHRAASSRLASASNSPSKTAIRSSSGCQRISISSIGRRMCELVCPADCRRSSVTRSLNLAPSVAPVRALPRDRGRQRPRPGL